jgi:hypothetical protein
MIQWTIVDERASTCVMSLSCSKVIDSLELTPSLTLLKNFYGRSLRPNGIILSCPIKLGGKSIYIEVEVVDTPLDYNLLLGRSWSYFLTIVISSVFHII